MIVTLKNDRFEVAVNTHGAEINAFRNIQTGTQYIWNGDPSVWKFHAPVLFPHVGRIRDSFMTVDGKSYELKVNGFSRDLDHVLQHNTEQEARFVLTESPETLARFPWKFKLETAYTLIENKLVFQTTVQNTDSTPMSFSMGSHTAFCCPRLSDPQGTVNADYQIEFEKREPLVSVVCTEDGYLAADDEGTAPYTVPYGEAESGIIPLSDAGFGNGHFFTAFTSDWVGLRNKKDNSVIKVNTKKYPYLMVWQNAGKPAFVCIEPWYGTPDPAVTDHEWEHKPALLTLAPGESFTSDQSITIE